MRIVVTGACGFVGRWLAEHFVQHGGFEVTGLDSLVRPGSEVNRGELRRLGVRLLHGDLRLASDVAALPEAEFVIDAAANPSVLAGTQGHGSSQQLVEHNLVGSLNLFEYCKRTGAGLVLLSTSRVYGLEPLAALALRTDERSGAPRFVPEWARAPAGLGEQGITEAFSVEPPLSLYGATKRAAEILALEYGAAFGFPVWVDRCGVLAGAGQFARADQGIFGYWLHRWKHGGALRYVGFDGRGAQVRDCLHPLDLAELVRLQLEAGAPLAQRVVNVAGGMPNACSLAELSAWCRVRFGARDVGRDPTPRPYDLPWVVLDSRVAQATWNWRPRRALTDVLEEIARHAEAEPRWLELTGGAS